MTQNERRKAHTHTLLVKDGKQLNEEKKKKKLHANFDVIVALYI